MAIEKTVDITVNTKNSQKEVKDLEKAIDGVNKEVKETNASTEVMSGTLDKVTGGAVGKFNAFKGALKGVTGGFKTMRTAIISTGLGALVVVIGSLIAAFKGSEDGQNKFAKLMGVIGAVVGNVVDVLADLGDFIIDLFSGDGDAMKQLKSFGASIFNVIGLPIKNVIDTVKALGKALGALFSGDISGAFDELKKGVADVKGNFDEAANSINGATDALKDFAKQNIEEAKAAAKVADQRAKADKIERDLILDKAKAEREIADLRLKARDLNNTTAKEREEALTKVLEISDDLIAREQEVAQLRADAQAAENTFARSNKENLTAEEEAKARVIRLETARLNQQRQIQRELTQAQNEQRREREARAKEEEARLKEEQKAEQAKIEEAAKKEQTRLDAIDKIREDYRLKQEDKEAETELQKIELEEQRKLAELERLKASEEQKLEVRAYYDQLRDEARVAQNAKQLEETKKLNEELAQAETNLQQAKASAIQGGLQVIGMLAGKSKAVSKTLLIIEKGLAIAQVISNASRAIAQAKANLAATPAVIGVVPNPAYAIQAVATAKGIAATKLSAATSIATIAAQAVSGLGGGGGGGSSVGGLGGGSSSAAQSAPPQFNIVGQDSNNQLAQTIAQQENQPVQAYVVANDVTTAQSLNNNIVEGATL